MPDAWYSHPAWLLDRLRTDWPDAWQEIAAANQRHPPLWLRVNRNRASVSDYAERLAAELGLTATSLPGFPDALKLESAVPVQRLPGFAEGQVSVQDAASQLAAHLLAPEPGMRVLDACAAPGGKTAHLLECAGGQLDLTALDISAERLSSWRATCSVLASGQPFSWAMRRSPRPGGTAGPSTASWWMRPARPPALSAGTRTSSCCAGPRMCPGWSAGSACCWNASGPC